MQFGKGKPAHPLNIRFSAKKGELRPDAHKNGVVDKSKQTYIRIRGKKTTVSKYFLDSIVLR
jgi:hypothetical protein